MDVRMPELDGIEATRQICADPATENVKVLILTTFDDDEQVYAAIRAGASGFLLKDVTPTVLHEAIRSSRPVMRSSPRRHPAAADRPRAPAGRPGAPAR